MSKITLTTTVSDLFFSKPNYERNITDIKNIYLSQLAKILTPCMFDSIKNIYNRSCEIAGKGNKMSIEYAFKVCLKDIINLSPSSINNEVSKIKQLSNSGSYFDNLVKSVIKSHIVLMSYNVSKESCPVCNMKNYNIDVNRFVHECYIELGNEIFNDPRIFVLCLKDGETLNNVNGNIRCGNKFDKIVKKCISKVVFTFIPVNDILVEYLNREKITDEHLQAKQEMEKEEFINRIIDGVSERVINSMRMIQNGGGINVDEIVEKIKNVVSIKKDDVKEEFHLEQPIDLNNQPIEENNQQLETVNQTIQEINRVIDNDISVKPTTEAPDPMENKEKENIENVMNMEIDEPEVKEEPIEQENKAEKKDENDDDEIILTENKLKTQEQPEENNINEMQQEIAAIEKSSRRRGRPKRFTETNDNNSISLNKFR